MATKSGMELPSVDGGMNKVKPRATEPPDDAKGVPEETPRQRYNRERKEAKDKKSRDEKVRRDKKKSDEKILRQAVKRYKRCVEAESDNRAAALEDLKFKAGKQGPSDSQ